MEPTELVKKPRAPRVKKTSIAVESAPVVEQLQEEVKQPTKPKATKVKKSKDVPLLQHDLKSNTPPLLSADEESKQVEKTKVIVGLDPGWLKCGLAVLTASDAKIVETQCVALRKQGVKQTQSQVEAQVNANLKRLFAYLYDKYDIDFVVIELQLGNFSCTPVQTAIVANLRDDTPFIVQHSKLKLKHPESKEVDNANKESKQYNQNKQLGRLLAQHIYKDYHEDNFDQCDSVLHTLYAFRNKSSIQFQKKQDY